MGKKPIITGLSLMTAFWAVEPLAYMANTYLGIPTNLKCEAQISDVAKEKGITVNGSLRYNPWLRECHFRYFDPAQNDVKIHSWHPILR